MDASIMIYDTLIRANKPDSGVFRALTGACKKTKQMPQAIRVWHEMVKYNIVPDKVLFTSSSKTSKLHLKLK
jgi:pentatricopeptide repeat protein